MTKNSVAIYTFSALVYGTAFIIYRIFTLTVYWDFYVVYVLCIIAFTILIAVLYKPNEIKVDRFPWFVYVLLPLISPIVAVTIVVYYCYKIGHWLLFEY